MLSATSILRNSIKSRLLQPPDQRWRIFRRHGSPLLHQRLHKHFLCLCVLALTWTIFLLNRSSHLGTLKCISWKDTKNQPTDFGLLFGQEFDVHGSAWYKLRPSNSSFWHFNTSVKLRQGNEGRVRLAVQQQSMAKLVVKQFRHGYDVERNLLPTGVKKALNMHNDQPMFWPSEIPATLLLSRLSGVISAHNGSALVSSPGYAYTNQKSAFGFEDDKLWQLATLHNTYGSLRDFADHVQLGDGPDTARQLDIQHRPALEHLLRTFAILGEYRICHDDVKADNIFVAADEWWHLGDFGQLRHASHAYHKSSEWINGYQWPDCKYNDVRRAIQSYLTFLRASIAPSQLAAFDRDLFAGEQPWSQLYWTFMHRPLLGNDAAALSSSLPPTAPPNRPDLAQPLPRWLPARLLLGSQRAHDLAAQWELSCKIANWWDRWGVRWWLFGTWQSNRLKKFAAYPSP